MKLATSVVYLDDELEQPGPSYIHGHANIIQSASSHESEQSAYLTLKEMFPDKNGEEIEQALRQAQFDLTVAINKLLFVEAGERLSLPGEKTLISEI